MSPSVIGPQVFIGYANLPRPFLDDLRSQGFTSVRAIAAQLKRAGHPDAPWWCVASNVSREVAVAVANGKLNGDHGTDDWMSLILRPVVTAPS